MSDSKARPREFSNDSDSRSNDTGEKERLSPEVNSDAIGRPIPEKPATSQRASAGASDDRDENASAADSEETLTILMGDGSTSPPATTPAKERNPNKTELFEAETSPKESQPITPQGSPTLALGGASTGPSPIESNAANSEKLRTMPLGKAIGPTEDPTIGSTGISADATSGRAPIPTMVFGQDQPATSSPSKSADATSGRAPIPTMVFGQDQPATPLPSTRTQVLEADNAPPETGSAGASRAPLPTTVFGQDDRAKPSPGERTQVLETDSAPPEAGSADSSRAPVPTLKLGHDNQATPSAGTPTQALEQSDAPPKAAVSRSSPGPLPTMVLGGDSKSNVASGSPKSPGQAVPETPTVALEDSGETVHASAESPPDQASTRTSVLGRERESQATRESAENQAANPSPTNRTTLVLDKASRARQQHGVDREPRTQSLRADRDIESLLDDMIRAASDEPAADLTAGRASDQVGESADQGDSLFSLDDAEQAPPDTSMERTDQLIYRSTRALAISALAILVSIASASASSKVASILFVCAVTSLLIGAFSFWRYSRLLRAAS